MIIFKLRFLYYVSKILYCKTFLGHYNMLNKLKFGKKKNGYTIFNCALFTLYSKKIE